MLRYDSKVAYASPVLLSFPRKKKMCFGLSLRAFKPSTRYRLRRRRLSRRRRLVVGAGLQAGDELFGLSLRAFKPSTRYRLRRRQLVSAMSFPFVIKFLTQLNFNNTEL